MITGSIYDEETIVGRWSARRGDPIPDTSRDHYACEAEAWDGQKRRTVWFSIEHDEADGHLMLATKVLIAAVTRL